MSAILFQAGDTVTTQKDLYLRWDDHLNCAIYKDDATSEEYFIPYDIIFELNSNFSDNSLSVFIRKNTIIGEIVQIFSKNHHRALTKAVLTSTYTTYYSAKIVTVVPLHNFYITLPLILLKKYNLS